jgi:hypothetical protein
MNTYSREFVFMCCALGGLLALLLTCWIQRIRDRRAARESAKRDRLHRIS